MIRLGARLIRGWCGGKEVGVGVGGIVVPGFLCFGMDGMGLDFGAWILLLCLFRLEKFCYFLFFARTQYLMY